jgi:hypothetical protein
VFSAVKAAAGITEAAVISIVEVISFALTVTREKMLMKMVAIVSF